MAVKRENLFDVSGGMNDTQSSYKIANNKFVKLEDVWINENGNIQTRFGTKKLIDIPATLLDTAIPPNTITIELPIKSIHVYHKEEIPMYFIEVGTNLILADNIENSTNWIVVRKNLDSNYRLHALYFENYLYFYNGINEAFYYDTKEIQSLTDMPIAKYCCVCNGRFFPAHFRDKTNKWAWSGIADYEGQEIFPDNPNAWKIMNIAASVGSDYGEHILQIDDEITGIWNYFNAVILIMMRYHIFTVTNLESNNPIDFTIKELKLQDGKSVGCTSFESIQLKDKVLVWASEDGEIGFNGSTIENITLEEMKNFYSTYIKHPKLVELIHTGGAGETGLGQEFETYDFNGLNNIKTGFGAGFTTTPLTWESYKGVIRCISLFGCTTTGTINMDMTTFANTYNSIIDTGADICKSTPGGEPYGFIAQYNIDKVNIHKIKVNYKWEAASIYAGGYCVLQVSKDSGATWIDKYTFDLSDTTQQTIEADINEEDVNAIRIRGHNLSQVAIFDLFEIWCSKGTAESPIFYCGNVGEWGKFYVDITTQGVNSGGGSMVSDLSSVVGLKIEIRGSDTYAGVSGEVWNTVTNDTDLGTLFATDVKYIQMRVTIELYLNAVTGNGVSMLKITYWQGGNLRDKPTSMIWNNSYLLFSEKTYCLDKKNKQLTHSLTAFSSQVIQLDNAWYPIITNYDNRGLWIFDKDPYGTDYGSANIINGTVITKSFFAEDPTPDKIMNKIRVGNILTYNVLAQYGSVEIWYKRQGDPDWSYHDTVTIDDYNKIEEKLPNLNFKSVQIKLIMIPSVYDLTYNYIHRMEFNFIEFESRYRILQP